eukprot:gene3409-2360_t
MLGFGILGLVSVPVVCFVGGISWIFGFSQVFWGVFWGVFCMFFAFFGLGARVIDLGIDTWEVHVLAAWGLHSSLFRVVFVASFVGIVLLCCYVFVGWGARLFCAGFVRGVAIVFEHCLGMLHVLRKLCTFTFNVCRLPLVVLCIECANLTISVLKLGKWSKGGACEFALDFGRVAYTFRCYDLLRFLSVYVWLYFVGFSLLELTVIIFVDNMHIRTLGWLFADVTLYLLCGLCSIYFVYVILCGLLVFCRVRFVGRELGQHFNGSGFVGITGFRL